MLHLSILSLHLTLFRCTYRYWYYIYVIASKMKVLKYQSLLHNRHSMNIKIITFLFSLHKCNFINQ